MLRFIQVQRAANQPWFACSKSMMKHTPVIATMDSFNYGSICQLAVDTLPFFLRYHESISNERGANKCLNQILTFQELLRKHPVVTESVTGRVTLCTGETPSIFGIFGMKNHRMKFLQRIVSLNFLFLRKTRTGYESHCVSCVRFFQNF